MIDLHDPIDVTAIVLLVLSVAGYIWLHMWSRKQWKKREAEEAARQAEAKKPVIIHGVEVEITHAEAMYVKEGDNFAGVVVRLPCWVDHTVWVAFTGQTFDPVEMGKEYESPLEAVNSLVKQHLANKLVGDALRKMFPKSSASAQGGDKHAD